VSSYRIRCAVHNTDGGSAPPRFTPDPAGTRD